MPQHKTTRTTIDYRNARYEGSIDSQSNRSQIGVLVDDDLSFYVSQWSNNQLDGQTLVYISHGKYIYGEWSDNEPHGLNVFRTGDTVLVGEFQNGEIIGKILVIFEKYNIIAVLQRTDKQKFQVIECGRLLSHDDLAKYIEILDVQMPENYFSLIKFVTSLTETSNNDLQESLIASPCQDGNCYFGYRDGLAIVFNSSNGVVSVGHHQSQKLCGFGGKFDGKKIQEGNFQLQQTIAYSKKRPNTEIYAIFQKLHKRSLNFRNQYFDSKVKTLGDLQTILRGNIQKIVNYNRKNGIRQTTAGELNDSLDYQVMDEYESIKAEENRQSMYEKEPSSSLKKTVSSYYNQQRDTVVGKTYSRASMKPQAESNTKRYSKVSNDDYYQQSQQEQTRRTPKKDTTVYYAKKSPIRYKEDERSVYERESRTCQKEVKNYQKQTKYYEKQTKNYERETRGRRYIAEDEQTENEVKVQTPTYGRSSNISQKKTEQNNRSRSPLNYKKSIELRGAPSLTTPSDNLQYNQKIPKFGGLELQDIQLPYKKTQTPFKKSTVEYEVEEYKRQLEKSRSKEKISGQSLSKCLKRPNYEDIEERRKRLLGQFKQLNTDSTQHSKVSNNERTPHKTSIHIDIIDSSQNSGKHSVVESPCMKEKILSFTSDDQNNENSSEGCLPLSLINNQRRNNRNRQGDVMDSEMNGSAFSKKLSTIDRLEFSNNKTAGKQNALAYTPGSFAKYKMNLDDIKVQNLPSEKKNDVRRFYCRESEQTMELLNMTKKPSSQHLLSQDLEEEEENHFSDIQLKHERNRKIDNFVDKRSDITENTSAGRSRQGMPRGREVPVAREREDYGQVENVARERDRSSLVEDISRRRKGYKYYFD